jgi:uncharacterized membrane protein YfcA
MSGLASMGGPPIVVYLLALSHRAATVRATSIIYFMLASMVAVLLMGLKGLIDREVLLWSIASMPVLWAGNHVGGWGFQRSQPHHHRIAALLMLTVLAVLLIARAVGNW